MNPVDVLRAGAQQEEEKRSNSLIPIAVAAGTGGALLGRGFDSAVNRLRRMTGNKATSYGGRFAGAGLAGLAAALGVNNMPNRSAQILAKAGGGGEITREDAEFIEQLTYQQAKQGMV